MKKLLIGLCLLTSLSYGYTENEIVNTTKKYNKYTMVNDKIILQLAKVESGCRDVVGDKNLKNKAYGILQMRQPAIDAVNKFYDIDVVTKAEELNGDIDKQIMYAVLYFDYLMYRFNYNEDLAIMAYNAGETKVSNGVRNHVYLSKVRGY
jgi:hypothetical protein